MEKMIHSYDGTELYLKKEVAQVPKAVVVIVHGLCEHLGRYDYLSDKLVAEEITTYRFDHRGHGKSAGKRVFYNEFNEIIDDVNFVVEMALKENPQLPVFLLGHSMGGFAVTGFGTKYPGKVKGIITSGALTRNNANFASELPKELPLDSYIPNALGDGVCSDPKVVEAYQKDPLVEKEIGIGLVRALLKGINWLKENPQKFIDAVLILHGANDGLVSEKDSRDLFGEIGSRDKTLKIYSGLCHEIMNEPCKDEIIEEIIAWLDKRL